MLSVNSSCFTGQCPHDLAASPGLHKRLKRENMMLFKLTTGMTVMCVYVFCFFLGGG